MMTKAATEKKLTVKELRELCHSCGLDVSGSKVDLKRRLEIFQTLGIVDETLNDTNTVKTFNYFDQNFENIGNIGNIENNEKERAKNQERNETWKTEKYIQDLEYEESLQADKRKSLDTTRETQCHEKCDENPETTESTENKMTDGAKNDANESENDSDEEYHISKEDLRLKRLAFFERK